MQLAKRISHAGLCSRRQAKNLIMSGDVLVNGKRIENPLFQVTEEDLVICNNQPLASIDPPRLWCYHKPRGLITSHADPENRPTVFDSLPKDLPRVISVGRLDINSEGLLLLTNNGELARFLELPKNKLLRTYHARVFGKLDPKALHQLKNGCTINGMNYDSIICTILEHGTTNHWLEITVTEGKNREIRKVMESIDLLVNRLIRISYGPFHLDRLKQNEIKEVRSKDVDNIWKI